MKKVLAVLLVIFIISWPLYIVYNRYFSTELQKENKGATQWKGVIKVWDFPRLNIKTGSRYGWINEKIKRFERENPGVFIELEPISWEKGPLKLEVALQTGNLPDIAPVATDFTYIREDILEPLDAYFSKEELNKFKSQALRAVTYDGKLWGVPFMMTTYVMYLNLDMFRERGVEPPIDGNWTYDEFVEKMQKLTWDSDGDGEVDHFGFTSFIEPNYYNLWGIILSDGAHIIDEESGKYVFYGEKAVKGLKKVVDLKDKYNVTPKDFGLLGENEVWDMFNNKQNIAVYPTGSWAVNVLQKQYQSGKGFDFAVANYPIGDRRIPISLNNSVSAYGIFKQENKQKMEMCVKFLKFIIQEEYQRELEDLGVFPTISSIKDIYTTNPKMKRVEDCLSYTQVIPKHKKWKDIDRVLQNQIRLAIIGKKEPEEAIEEAKIQVEQILDK